ncbi:alpha/beta fold hydrolase [Azospirillum canadense]|uniref:alpha/beta fold hydrolase n=1 Tax=Azospirillum canadense TaxID=403962 RepID=UPI0022272E35|nr:alpha/beta hydrolase [Azospirillum canadense]MCW2242338.1 pimeloyl-ACP methyl ester carboxylesterase [Azospirillum canadense]
MPTTRDGSIRYERSGRGQPLMLIHGVGANLESWDGVCATLGGEFDVIRLDLRGHGGSARIDGALAIDDFAMDVLKVMDDAGVSRAHLVGFSLGGLIAQRLAQGWPERFDRVVILSAVAARTPEERERVLARLNAIREGGMEAIVGAATDRWFTEAFARTHPDVIANRIAELKAVHVPSYLEAYRVFGQTELVDSLHLIPHETLVMTGEFDQGSNVRMAETMKARIPNAELRILPGLKHSVLAEAPDLVASHVSEFLNRHST